MKQRLLVAALTLALASGCKDTRNKAEKLADTEAQLVVKIEKLKQRQQQTITKLADLENRLAQVRDQRSRIRDRFSEPTPTP